MGLTVVEIFRDNLILHDKHLSNADIKEASAMGRKCVMCRARSPSVKFNEIPSDPVLREQWLTVIPDHVQFGVNPVVCNRHFEDSDYIESRKHRVLKRGVIPKIVPFTCASVILSETKKIVVPKVVSKPIPKLTSQIDPTYIQEDEENNGISQPLSWESKEKDSGPIVKKSKLKEIQGTVQTITKEPFLVPPMQFAILDSVLGTDFQVQPFSDFIEVNVEKSNHTVEILKEGKQEIDLNFQSLSSEVKQLKAKCHQQEVHIKSKEKSLEIANVRVKVLEKVARERKLELARLKVKAAKEKDAQLKKIRNLKEQYNRLVQERREIESSTYLKNIEDMLINMDQDRKAAFLLDQVKLYKMKVPRYADSTLQECIIWEGADPKGYQFARDNDLLTLPAHDTMKKHLSIMDSNLEISIPTNGKSKPIQSPTPSTVEIKLSDKLIVDEMVVYTDHVYTKNPVNICTEISK